MTLEVNLGWPVNKNVSHSCITTYLEAIGVYTFFVEYTSEINSYLADFRPFWRVSKKRHRKTPNSAKQAAARVLGMRGTSFLDDFTLGKHR